MVFGILVLGRYQAEYSTGIPLDWNLGRRKTWRAGHSACQGISRFYSASENLWIQNTKIVHQAIGIWGAIPCGTFCSPGFCAAFSAPEESTVDDLMLDGSFWVAF